jgi:hypothetical protein
LIHPGERDRAIEYLRAWLEAHASDYLYICDPYFGMGDLEAMTLVLSVDRSFQTTILTSRKKQTDDGIRDDYGKAYLEYWHKHFSEQDLPFTELAIVGTQTTGELPIHDRWWLTRGAGICLGTSFNGLGGSKTSEISVLLSPELEERTAEVEQYLRRLKRDHGGEKLNFNFVSL